MAEQVQKAAAPEVRQPTHRNFDQMVAYALVRAIARTQKEAAQAAGISIRTARNYEGHEDWDLAIQEAMRRWRPLAALAARSRVLEAIRGGSVADAWRLLELEPEFRPVQANPGGQSVSGAVANAGVRIIVEGGTPGFVQPIEQPEPAKVIYDDGDEADE